MRIYAKVTPRAGKNEVLKISDGEYKVKVTAVPEKGKANEAVIKLLADYFDVPKSLISIIGGKSTRVKLIEIG
ncbi:MAG: DUF167 domain-containing protein [Parcubacteria group bacterium]|jgi:hypothetical protein